MTSEENIQCYRHIDDNKIELLKDSLYYVELTDNSYSYDRLVYYPYTNYYGFFNDLDKIENEIVSRQQKEKEIFERSRPNSCSDTKRLCKILKYRKLKNNYNSSDFSHPELCYRPSPQLNNYIIGLINDFTGLDYVFVITDEDRSGKIPRVILNDQNVPEEKEVHRIILNKLSKRKSRISYQTSQQKMPLSLYHYNLIS